MLKQAKQSFRFSFTITLRALDNKHVLTSQADRKQKLALKKGKTEC